MEDFQRGALMATARNGSGPNKDPALYCCQAIVGKSASDQPVGRALLRHVVHNSSAVPRVRIIALEKAPQCTASRLTWSRDIGPTDL